METRGGTVKGRKAALRPKGGLLLMAIEGEGRDSQAKKKTGRKKGLQRNRKRQCWKMGSYPYRSDKRLRYRESV